MKLKTLSASIGLALTLAAGSVLAAPINGTASISGGLAPAAAPNAIVSTLTFANLNDLQLVVSTTGDFIPDGVSTGLDFMINPAMPGQIFAQFNGFTFTIGSIANIVPLAFTCGPTGCNDGLAFDVAGTVTGAGFTPTAFTAQFTANGTCNQLEDSGLCAPGTKSPSYSASITAEGIEAPPVVPEPTSLALVGIALAGVGFASRRNKRG